jgi:ATP-binding cassette subfamily G (WHITE) protein 2 (SNQ2)
VVVALTFLRLDNSLQSLQYRVFAIYFTTLMPALILAQVQPQYIFSRMTYDREASSKMYSSTVFALSQLIAEIRESTISASTMANTQPRP